MSSTLDPTTLRSEAPALATLGALKESGYATRSVREEMRSNLIAKIRKGDTLFPGVVGYELTVIPSNRKCHSVRPGHHLSR